MADNVGYTPGSGATIAADDVGGVLYQRVKVTAGPENSATDISEVFPLPTSDAGSNSLLTRILQMLIAPLGYDKSIQRQRGTVVVETLPTLAAVTTVTTVTTCSTVSAVTALNNIDGYNGRMQILDQNRTAWALCVRARIT